MKHRTSQLQRHILRAFTIPVLDMPPGIACEHGITASGLLCLITGDCEAHDTDSRVRRSCESLVKRGELIKTFTREHRVYTAEQWPNRQVLWYATAEWLARGEDIRQELERRQSDVMDRLFFGM